MKKIAKLLALVLALTLLLSLAACSGKGKANSIVGTWKYTLDFQKAMESGSEDMEALGEMADAIKGVFDGLTMDVILDLKEDNTFTFQFDEASAKAAVEGMFSKIGEALPSLLASSGSGTEEEIAAALEEAGLTMEELMQQVMGNVDTDEMVKSLTESNQEGTWRYEDGKLYLTEKDKTEDAEDYAVVELNGSELKIVSFSKAEDGMAEGLKNMLPLIFVRVK